MGASPLFSAHSSQSPVSCHPLGLGPFPMAPLRKSFEAVLFWLRWGECWSRQRYSC